MLLVYPYVAYMHTKDYNTIMRCLKKVFIYPTAQFLCPLFSLPTCSPPGESPTPPRSDHNEDPVPPPPATAEAGSILTGLTGTKAEALPSSPAKVRIAVLHPDDKIVTAMMDEEGGGSRATMVTAEDDGKRGNHRLSRRCWRLKVVLPSSALLPSHNDGGLRGPQKPVARRTNAVADAVTSVRCTAVGVAASRGTKTKVEAEADAEATTATAWLTRMARMARMAQTAWTARTAQTMPVLAVSRRQGVINNWQGQEAATDGSRVGADGRVMMHQWSRQTTTTSVAAFAQAATICGSRLSSPPPPSPPLATMVVGAAHRSLLCVARMPGKDKNVIIFKQT